MKKLLRTIAAVVAAVGLAAPGLVAADNSATIDTTGPDSYNKVEFENETDVDVDFDNDVDADVDVDQDADSGEAEVEWNTEGGDAESGSAMNDASLDADVDINNDTDLGDVLGGGNGGSNEATIGTTGPGSYNKVEVENDTDVDVDVDNHIDFDIDVDQDADSGDAEVKGNTSGGNATSGDAHNTFSGTFNVSIN